MISKPPNISSASAKSKPCFRILERFFASSHSKVIVTPIVATYKRFIHAASYSVPADLQTMPQGREDLWLLNRHFFQRNARWVQNGKHPCFPWAKSQLLRTSIQCTLSRFAVPRLILRPPFAILSFNALTLRPMDV